MISLNFLDPKIWQDNENFVCRKCNEKGGKM